MIETKKTTDETVWCKQETRQRPSTKAWTLVSFGGEQFLIASIWLFGFYFSNCCNHHRGVTELGRSSWLNITKLVELTSDT